jgi:hypothetical protein
MSLLREYIKGILVEQEVKFSGILKLIPSPDIVSAITSLLGQLPPDAVPLSEDRFHVTLAHQSVLKPYRKQLKQMSKEDTLPPPPPVVLENGWEVRPLNGKPDAHGRKSWVVWVKNQDALRAYVQEVIQAATKLTVQGELPFPVPSQRFHISIANLTGNPGDSVA